MIRSVSILLALALCAAPTGAVAQPAHCPPGLAKKSPACVPPGQAKKWRVGDRYDGGGHLIHDYDRYNLPPLRRNEAWYRVGDTFIRIDRDTRDILQLVEAAARVLN
jgi:Ni/Co efflux regulator RcnB